MTPDLPDPCVWHPGAATRQPFEVTYRLEFGDELHDGECGCCGVPFVGGRGFVYRDRDAFATYWVNLYAKHPDRRAVLLLTLDANAGADAWEPGVTTLIEVWPTDTDLVFGLHDPHSSPWKLDEYDGQVLTREQALAHEQLSEIWSVAEHIVYEDPAIRRHLNWTDT